MMMMMSRTIYIAPYNLTAPLTYKLINNDRGGRQLYEKSATQIFKKNKQKKRLKTLSLTITGAICRILSVHRIIMIFFLAAQKLLSHYITFQCFHKCWYGKWCDAYPFVSSDGRPCVSPAADDNLKTLFCDAKRNRHEDDVSVIASFHVEDDLCISCSQRIVGIFVVLAVIRCMEFIYIPCANTISSFVATGY